MVQQGGNIAALRTADPRGECPRGECPHGESERAMCGVSPQSPQSPQIPQIPHSPIGRMRPSVILDNLRLLLEAPSLVWELQPDLVRPNLLVDDSDGDPARDPARDGDDWDIIERPRVPKPDEPDEELSHWEVSHQLTPHTLARTEHA
uniref:Uncharacterized protein n=1 Tax=Haptolina ericina TaxID=156174 RepID=A0A7S3BG97_9EUKA